MVIFFSLENVIVFFFSLGDDMKNVFDLFMEFWSLLCKMNGIVNYVSLLDV